MKYQVQIVWPDSSVETSLYSDREEALTYFFKLKEAQANNSEELKGTKISLTTMGQVLSLKGKKNDGPSI